MIASRSSLDSDSRTFSSTSTNQQDSGISTPVHQILKKKNVQVFIRIRPIMDHEKDGDKCVIECVSKRKLMLHSASQNLLFTFDEILTDKCNQAEVFQHCGLNKLIEFVLEG
ncbi:hypothetical protein Ciccas_000431 [Cichlidogyrus casuarinus]|uniref:Kinesin motor domain-containing protein n=1 Tax=Cichlidogyrus casuarinus TaxID=1844966 RepID=A0ABD2QMZ9_9PLAT